MDQRIPPLLLGLAGALGLLAQGLLVGPALGVNALILVVAIVGAIALVRRPGGTIDRLDLWIPPAAVALAASAALRADPALVSFDLQLTAGLLGASAAALSGVAVTRRSAVALVALGAALLELTIAGAARLARLSRPWIRTDRLRLGPGGRAVVRGFAIALPVLVVFSVLFAAADAVFERALQVAFAWEVDLGELPGRLLVAAIVAWPVAGLLGTAAYGLPRIEARSLGAATRAPELAGSGERSVRLGGVEALVVLAAVDVLFAAFVLLQVAYLFGGRDTLAAAGLTYSEYARRGFFELVAVAALAGALLAGLRGLVADPGRSFVAAGLALLGLTAGVVVSAAMRLRLYQEAYGWTELRFYVAVAIGWLVAALLLTAILLVRDRMGRLPHVLGILALTATIAVTAIGPRGFVAERNVDRLLDPSLVAPGGYTGFDLDYLIPLGDEAIPALARAQGHLPVSQDEVLRGYVAVRRDQLLADAGLLDWRAWNLSRERARESLRSIGG